MEEPTMTTAAEVLQFLFDMGSVVAEWITILLSTISAITLAVITNPIFIVVAGLLITYKASNFGLGAIRKLVRVFK